MAKKNAPPRTPVARGEQTLVQDHAPKDSVDWNALVEPIRKKTNSHDLAQRLLEIGKTMSTSAAHMYLLGEYLLTKKKEILHGEFGNWIEEQGLVPRTGRKYMAFARRMARWTQENGTHVPFCTLTALVQGDLPEPEAAAQVRDAADAPPTTEELDPVDRGTAAQEAVPPAPRPPIAETRVLDGPEPQQDEPVEPDEEPGETREQPHGPPDEAEKNVSDADDRDLVAVVERFASALDDIGAGVIDGMDRAQLRQLAEAMQRAEASLNALKQQAIQRSKAINRVEMEKAS